jgi:putative hydrolase of the HAD superfamily
MTIKCITFDLDDTLWACSPVLHRAEKKCYQWFKQYYPKITANYSEQQLFESRRQYMLNHPEQVFNLTQIRIDWLAQIADEFSYSSHMVDDGFQIFWLARNEVTLFRGVLESLEQLSANFSLGVISNGNADVNHIGIGEYFDFSVNVVEAGCAKPDREIFQHALRLANYNANEVLHIGDDPYYDVLGALNAGFYAIWYNPEKKAWLADKKPSEIIQTLDQIEAKISSLDKNSVYLEQC